MSGTITPVDQFDATVPDILNGDDGNQLTFHSPLQALTNRTHNLNLTLTSRGAPRVRSVATVAALKGVTGQQTGDHAVVKDVGLFEFDASSSAATDDVTVVAPNVGGGRWLSVFRSARVANGFAPLDSAGKVPQANLRGALASTGSSSTGSTTSGNITSQTQTILSGQLPTALAVGDALDVEAIGTMTISTGSESITMQLSVVQPDTAEVVVGHAATSQAALDKLFSIRGLFVATQAGSHTLKLVARYSTVPGSFPFTLQSGCRFLAHRFLAP